MPGVSWAKNLLFGRTLTEAELRDIPYPRLELHTHVMYKTIQVGRFSLCHQSHQPEHCFNSPQNRGWDTQFPMHIGKLVLICKAMGICLIFVNIEVRSKLLNYTSDLLFTKYQADPHCLANQNKPDKRHWNRVSHCL